MTLFYRIFSRNTQFIGVQHALHCRERMADIGQKTSPTNDCGAEFDAMGAMMREAANKRKLTVDKKQPTWTEIVEADPSFRQKLLFEYRRRSSKRIQSSSAARATLQ